MDHNHVLTVAELIELLRDAPPDAHVHCTHSAGSGETGVYGVNRLESLDQNPPYLILALEGY